MRKRYYGVFRRVNSETKGEVIEILKDPDFNKIQEEPFNSFQTIDDDEPFLPWLTTYQSTAEAQAMLLEMRDNIKYHVGYGDVDFFEILKNTAVQELKTVKKPHNQ